MSNPQWMRVFDEVLDNSRAGLPQDKNVRWTYLTLPAIREGLSQKGINLTEYHVRQMLQERGYKKRKMLKKNTLKQTQGPDKQFEKIANYRSCFSKQGLPILSIDTKKKELIGNFSRRGTAYATQARKANDHDFLSIAQGQIVPHGIYDVTDNTGYITLGTSKDTSAFVWDNIQTCWREHLQYNYPVADTLLLLCDGGGSNASAQYIVKQELVKLATCLHINILVSHLYWYLTIGLIVQNGTR